MILGISTLPPVDLGSLAQYMKPSITNLWVKMDSDLELLHPHTPTCSLWSANQLFLSVTKLRRDRASAVVAPKIVDQSAWFPHLLSLAFGTL